jgi:hypothetical protein
VARVAELAGTTVDELADSKLTTDALVSRTQDDAARR